MMPATSSLHVRGGAPEASRMRAFRLPLAFHSLGREGVKSVMTLWSVTRLRRVAKYFILFGC